MLCCRNCGVRTEEQTVVEVKEQMFSRRGQSRTFESPVRCCKDCGEEIFDRELDSATLQKFFALLEEK